MPISELPKNPTTIADYRTIAKAQDESIVGLFGFSAQRITPQGSISFLGRQVAWLKRQSSYGKREAVQYDTSSEGDNFFNVLAAHYGESIARAVEKEISQTDRGGMFSINSRIGSRTISMALKTAEGMKQGLVERQRAIRLTETKITIYQKALEELFKDGGHPTLQQVEPCLQKINELTGNKNDSKIASFLETQKQSSEEQQLKLNKNKYNPDATKELSRDATINLDRLRGHIATDLQRYRNIAALITKGAHAHNANRELARTKEDAIKLLNQAKGTAVAANLKDEINEVIENYSTADKAHQGMTNPSGKA